MDHEERRYHKYLAEQEHWHEEKLEALRHWGKIIAVGIYLVFFALIVAAFLPWAVNWSW